MPTSDSVCYTYLLDSLLAAGKHVLCVGETGTGKTLNVASKLLNNMPEEVCVCVSMSVCVYACLCALVYLAAYE